MSRTVLIIKPAETPEEIERGEMEVYARAQFSSNMVMVRCIAENSEKELAEQIFRELVQTAKYLSRRHGFVL